MKIKYKKKYVVLSLLLVLSVAVVYSLFAGGQEVGADKTTTVKSGVIQSTLEETGTVYSKRVNTFYSDFSQKVKVLNVSVGDKVEKGDIILTYDNNYDLEIERANKQIEAVTATYNETIKGADFKEISNMKLNISTIEGSLNLARNNFEKIKDLYENNAVSQVEYDEAKNNVTTLENQLQEANNNYDLLLRGVSSNVKKQYESQIEEIMVQIKILEKNIEQSSIKAEFDGIITELNVHQGGMTQPGVIVVEIQDEKNLGVYVEVLAEDAIKTSKDMPFIIDLNGDVKELTINRVYPKATSSVSELGVEQKRVRIEADLEADNKMKIGTEVDVVIVLEEKDNVLIVDRDAVYEKSYKEYVTVIAGDKQIETEVTTGLKNDDFIEIISGLKENDVVLLNY
ncbi:HlyD family efflux transporter periplasmic adaptor subunit [Sedimentibacter hydroxybenzoicus DSM 7310]|uniref:HlyD family efflux transporter periplasmic adaptor subunit n=1 Tax=Sedimentibacter hydroxybenzoicus DSM 7310 TaxID=1123245 RepID=A0A974GX03_SEDHY|nr:HlyD family efflux transporter periplasmic adaptor subunit [Sedimentibacter hydroxybenzoicus]NYB74781.1 HlyD family efflux transporter periplasmic adaptor subunit [Sedimentibacter hydroxybenzoicus DSM 7310]